VRKGYGQGMKRQLLVGGILLPVFVIADYWMAGLCEMYPYLVFSSREKPDFQKAKSSTHGTHRVGGM
jgi:hypothetical protein